MNGPRDCHTEGRNSEKENYHLIACMWNLKNKITNKLIYKTDTEKELTITSREVTGSGIVREFGINIYTLLYLKRIINKDLLHSMGNSAQYHGTT